MKIKVTLLRIIFSSFVLMLIPSAGRAEDQHEWTGFMYANGNSNKPDRGGPFKNSQDCFAWGKSKVWRATDVYRCGKDCKRDSAGRLVCTTIESEETLAAAEAKAKAEEEAKKPKEEKKEEDKSSKVLQSGITDVEAQAKASADAKTARKKKQQEEKKARLEKEAAKLAEKTKETTKTSEAKPEKKDPGSKRKVLVG